MNKKVNNLRQICSVTQYTITSGRASGLDVIDCDNGRIRFLLSPSRGLDMLQLWHRGENVSFISKNGFVGERAPFLERFEGGMLYTCGLDNVGYREGFEQHGTYHLTGADVTLAKADVDGITVEGYIRRSALFGQNLVIKRRVHAAIGSDTVTVSDTLTNEGYRDAEYSILYHFNVGYPMLDRGGRIEGKIEKIDCSAPFARENIDRALVMEEAVLPDEACYFLTLAEPEISYVNEAYGKSLTLRYSQNSLPRFLMWKSNIAGDYALGLEPTTMNLGGDYKAIPIRAGDSVDFTLSLTVNDL